MSKLNFSDRSPVNLSFSNLGKADFWYRKYACTPLDELDNQVVFKQIFFYFLQVAAYGLLLYGLYTAIEGLFEDGGYLDYADRVNTGAQIVGILMSLVQLVISICGFLLIFSIINNRSRKLFSKTFRSVVDFFAGNLLPTVFIISGEILLVLFGIAFSGQLLGALSASPVYNPVAVITEPIMKIFYELINVLLFPNYFIEINLAAILFPFQQIPDLSIYQPIFIYDDYKNIGDVLTVAVMLLVSGFYLLVVTYLVAEIFRYLYRLVTLLLDFLPRFIIPIKIGFFSSGSKSVANS